MACNEAARHTTSRGRGRFLMRSLQALSLLHGSEALTHGHLRAHPAAGSPEQTEPTAALPAVQYFGEVLVGKPSQPLRVVFDTGSGTIVIPSSRCEDAACTSHRRFFAENSTTAVQIGWSDDPTTPVLKDEDRDTKGFSLFGTDVSGEFIRDTVCVGEAKQCSPVDFVGLTEESSDPFAQLEFDGVFGLAPSSPDAKEFNFMHSFFSGRPSSESVFSLYLTPSSGELTFGGYRKERAAANLLWAPTTSNNTWRVMIEDVAVDGKRVGLCDGRGCEASVDSGSSLIMASGNALWTLLTKLGIDDDCSVKAPKLAFIVNGHHLELEMDDYVERDAEGCRLLFGSTSSVEKAPAFVLGYPFLRRYFTVFDLGQSRIGFAPASHAKIEAGIQNANIAVVPLKGIRP